MKKMTYIAMLVLAYAGMASAAETPAHIDPPANPAVGIWIQQVGDIVPHASTRATLYYTK